MECISSTFDRRRAGIMSVERFTEKTLFVEIGWCQCRDMSHSVSSSPPSFEPPAPAERRSRAGRRWFFVLLVFVLIIASQAATNDDPPSNPTTNVADTRTTPQGGVQGGAQGNPSPPGVEVLGTSVVPSTIPGAPPGAAANVDSTNGGLTSDQFTTDNYVGEPIDPSQSNAPPATAPPIRNPRPLVSPEPRVSEEEDTGTTTPPPAEKSNSSGPYANCTEARQSGPTPIYRGDPNYGEHMDADNDGIACE